MKHAWENVLELNLSVDRVESNPQLVQIVPPNEVVVLISFELTIGDLRGMMNLCIPFNSIERISGKLSSQQLGQLRQAASLGRDDQADQQQPATARSSNWSSHLAETKITTGDLIGLRVGDIITTEKDIHSPIAVSVEGVVKFHAKPGASKGTRRSSWKPRSPPPRCKPAKK